MRRDIHLFLNKYTPASVYILRWASRSMRIGVVLAMASLMAAPQLVAAQAPQSTRVSVIQLVATPERYHGKLVFVTGFLTIELENESLCATPVVASSKDCVQVQYDDGPWQTAQDMKRYDAATAKWKAMSGKRISIRATFNQENTGHLGMSSGGLEHIIDVYADE